MFGIHNIIGHCQKLHTKTQGERNYRDMEPNILGESHYIPSKYRTIKNPKFTNANRLGIIV